MYLNYDSLVIGNIYYFSHYYGGYRFRQRNKICPYCLIENKFELLHFYKLHYTMYVRLRCIGCINEDKSVYTVDSPIAKKVLKITRVWLNT